MPVSVTSFVLDQGNRVAVIYADTVFGSFHTRTTIRASLPVKRYRTFSAFLHFLYEITVRITSTPNAGKST